MQSYTYTIHLAHDNTEFMIAPWSNQDPLNTELLVTLTNKMSTKNLIFCFFNTSSNKINQWSPPLLLSNQFVFQNVSLVFLQHDTQALAPRWFSSSPSSASLLQRAGFFLLGLRPRASASSNVVVRGSPRVSGNNNVSTPIINARIPTMSYMQIVMKKGKYQFNTTSFATRTLL